MYFYLLCLFCSEKYWKLCYQQLLKKCGLYFLPFNAVHTTYYTFIIKILFKFFSNELCSRAVVITAFCNVGKPCVCWLILSPRSRCDGSICSVISIKHTRRRVYMTADSLTSQPVVEGCGSEHYLSCLVRIQRNWFLEYSPTLGQNTKSIFRNSATSWQPMLVKKKYKLDIITLQQFLT